MGITSINQKSFIKKAKYIRSIEDLRLEKIYFYYNKFMKVLILAAGLGSRLKNKTINVPKALVKIKSKPIISHQIEALKYNKLYEIGVVLGYKSDVLKKYLLDTHKDINFSFFLMKIMN